MTVDEDRLSVLEYALRRAPFATTFALLVGHYAGKSARVTIDAIAQKAFACPGHPEPSS